MILSFFKSIAAGCVAELVSHVIVTFVSRFKSHPRSELDDAGGVAWKVSIEDVKESKI